MKPVAFDVFDHAGFGHLSSWVHRATDHPFGTQIVPQYIARIEAFDPPARVIALEIAVPPWDTVHAPDNRRLFMEQRGNLQ